MSTPRSYTHVAGIACFFALMSIGSSVYAQGFEYLVENQKSTTDSDGPVLVLKVTDLVKGGKLTISGGYSKSMKLQRMNPGKVLRIPLKVKKGEHTIDVKVESTTLNDEKVAIAFQFNVARVEPMKLMIDRDKVDTTKGVIPFRVNVPLDRAEVEFFDTDGNKIGTEIEQFGGKSGNLVIDWSAGEEIGGISIVAYDTQGFWSSVLLEPWWIEIEHEEIIFDFGKATWQKSEEPKLEKSLAEIKSAMKKHAKHRPDMRLYVAGYTDRVGSAAQNKKLSEARARAIAKWFKKKGVDMPVYAQGFGESVMAVKTPDETPEERNRRAIYVLGNGPPPTSNDIPSAAWKIVK